MTAASVAIGSLLLSSFKCVPLNLSHFFLSILVTTANILFLQSLYISFNLPNISMLPFTPFCLFSCIYFVPNSSTPLFSCIYFVPSSYTPLYLFCCICVVVSTSYAVVAHRTIVFVLLYLCCCICAVVSVLLYLCCCICNALSVLLYL